MKGLLAELKIAKKIVREEGFKSLFRKYGWKLVAAIFVYYLVRDVTLYILLPMLIFQL